MDIVSRFLQYSQLEEKYAEEIKRLGDMINHPVLKALFHGIARDSEKHGYMYRSIAELLSKIQPYISEKDLEEISKVIKKHVETEARMLEEARRLLLETSDPRVKLLIAAIADDEAKHHALLKSIEKRIAEEETLREDIIWDMIWKDSPWHGTPGG
ncbi:MAG: ferritin-like domain-containing protein [Desulfurococcaceae archaeon]